MVWIEEIPWTLWVEMGTWLQPTQWGNSKEVENGIPIGPSRPSSGLLRFEFKMSPAGSYFEFSVSSLCHYSEGLRAFWK